MRLFGKRRGEIPTKTAETAIESLLPLDVARTRISAAHTVAEIIDALREAGRTVVGSDGITVIRREGEEVLYVTEDAISPLWAGQRFPMQSCISGMAIQARKPIAIPDILLDKRVPLNAYLATFVKSMVIVPIGHGEPQMAMGAYWRVAQPIASIALDRLTALASAAGDALERIEGRPPEGRQVA